MTVDRSTGKGNPVSDNDANDNDNNTVNGVNGHIDNNTDEKSAEGKSVNDRSEDKSSDNSDNKSLFPGSTLLQMPRSYNDVVLTITEQTTPDPYVVWDKGVYYMTWTAGNRIEIWSADSLFDFEKRSQKTTIWYPPPNTPYSGDLWAPELHSLQGTWYVYFAADDPREPNPNHSHRMYVLSGPPSSSSPLNSSDWKFHGALAGMLPDQWAIDGTVIHLHSKMYFVYSGWPIGVTDNERKQELFIIEMSTPTTCIGRPTRISTPDFQWEFSGRSGINEGPQWLRSPDGRWCGIAYSCAGSWTSEYKMAVLEYAGGDPLDEKSWKKWREPFLKCSKNGKPPYGPGHGNFVEVEGVGGKEVWGVFHATDARTGWEGRKARVMRVGWGEGGPHMGTGECGVCCEDVEWFLYGLPEGIAPPDGDGGKGAGKKIKDFVGGAKGLVRKVFK